MGHRRPAPIQHNDESALLLVTLRYWLLTHAQVYYKEAKAGLIVFDGSNGTTFESVERWKTDLDNKVSLDDGAPLPVLLLANKVRFCTNTDAMSWLAVLPTVLP